MKFKIDENLPIELAHLLQDEGYDASTIYSESLKGAKDTTVIAVCQDEHRVLIENLKRIEITHIRNKIIRM
ncbi:DUF5615 family PIN-like protein [Pseudanabaena sp. Chao 1811]|uniref:DUF5615 family PIN-like protein n=1 Tax=Pseudanabaena sp. Chao 1811 TaxID=2963092 RepID=UPI0022F3CF84|nr:DUF5615 family PIN-like protein [Pseudanabaena sp. Chao 1811]